MKTDLSALNENQVKAVVSDGLRLLVLAGAGSGKTKTLLQKIVYLIEEKGVAPTNILAITFTRNATHEMVDRLLVSSDGTGNYEKIISNRYTSQAEKDRERFAFRKTIKWIDNLTIRTFHGFCYSVLRNHGVNEFDNRFKIIGDEKRTDDDQLATHVAPETTFEVFHKILIEESSNPTFLLKLKRYVLDYMVDRIHVDRNQFKHAVSDGKFFTSLNGTKVRSKSEQFIADWLYRHNIKFEYEPLLQVKEFPFRPDFYIPEANLYIEHVSDKSYDLKRKEDQFQKGKLLLVKTYEAMTKDSALFNHTLESIVRSRLPEQYDLNANLTYREEFHGYHEEVRKFLTQVMRITDMLKVENIAVDTISENASRDQHERVRSFYTLALPVVEKYIAYCTDKSYLDFNDLISKTISLFKNYPDVADNYKRKFQYLLVDEFQDVNNLQVELIKLMLTDTTQLFCVGDDWQSIYGFRGSNVSYIIDFENHFENAEVVKLNLNYRSTQHIVGASNEVIKHNKFKVEKDIQSSRKSEHKIVVFAGNTEEENIQFAIEEVRSFMAEGLKSEDILFLYRRSKMFSNYFQQERSYYHQLKNHGLRVQGKTIHAAKGLEAKVVFILGLTEGDGGFPDVWLEDRIFQTIKKANHDLLLEEERRLFYVAMTRAKEKLFLLTQKGNESSFLKEIPDAFTVRSSIPIKAMIEKIITCSKCYSELNKLWMVCPYCGKKV